MGLWSCFGCGGQLSHHRRVWDEYDYEETNADGWSSDTWVSYLVVISPSGETVFSGVFGDKEGNNAGEYLTVMRSGDLMVYTDSDTVPGAGFLKLTKTY